MKKPLKRAIRVNFDAALENHLPEDGVAHDTALLAIGHAALDEMDLAFDGMTVAEIVEGFDLQPFVEMARKYHRDAAKQGGVPAGVAVICHGRIFRTAMRRLVTALAECRTADYELLLEDMDGEFFGFVAESEVERLTDFTAENLAKLVGAEELDFEQALKFLLIQRDEELTIELFMACELAISWANMGKPETRLELPGNGKMTAAEIIRQFGLEPFIEVEAERQSEG